MKVPDKEDPGLIILYKDDAAIHQALGLVGGPVLQGPSSGGGPPLLFFCYSLKYRERAVSGYGSPIRLLRLSKSCAMSVLARTDSTSCGKGLESGKGFQKHTAQ